MRQMYLASQKPTVLYRRPTYNVLYIITSYIHAVQTVTRIRIGGSPIMPTSARERDKLQCKQTMDKYTCQVKAVLIIFS